MKKLTTLLMTLMLMSTALWADQTITVSANSSDISEGLDLKVVAKLFAEAKNLEEFETMLNNPDSAFCNLDLNGDGQVDYLRVVETGEGNKRLIVLQAILAKDIYQDVASIYVEKDEATNNVSVQVIGDEYIYGTNYIIEPVYLYRPVIYDWFWSPYWCAWHSPWYWGYYPGWWYVHRCWAHDWYWHHCYAFHHHHHYCSFRPGRTIHHGYHELRSGVTRREYATAHPERSFSQRNSGMTNAREIRNTSGVSPRQTQMASGARNGFSTGRVQRVESARQPVGNRTYGSTNTVAARSQSTNRATAARTNTSTATVRTNSNTATVRTSTTNASARSTAGSATSTTYTKSSATASRSTGTTATKSSATTVRSTAPVTRSTSSAPRSTSTYSGNNRSSSSGSSTRSSGTTYSSGSRTSSSSGASTRTSTYSGGGRSSGSSGGGGATRSSGGSSSGARTRR